jgi:hypothetical protein
MNLIPNIKQIDKILEDFAEKADASEVMLFEKNTYLAISHCKRVDHNDDTVNQNK